MVHTTRSATEELKRKLAISGVALLGTGVILHFTIPWFDFLQRLGWGVDLAFDYPKVTMIPLAFLLLIFIMAAVDDRFPG